VLKISLKYLVTVGFSIYKH